VRVGPSMKSSKCPQDRRSYQGTLAIPPGADMLFGTMVLENGRVVIWAGGCPFLPRRRVGALTTCLEVEEFDEFKAGTPSPAAI